MNRMFAKTEKMKAATRTAMERLKAMPASDLLAFGAEHADSDLAIFLTESADDHQAEGRATVAFTPWGEYRAEAPGIARLGANENYEFLRTAAFSCSAAFSHVVIAGNAAMSRAIPKFDFEKIAVMCGPVVNPMLNFDTNVAA